MSSIARPKKLEEPEGFPLRDPAALRALLPAGGELALLDAREEGAFSGGHLFHAVNAPLSRLELILDGLVPRRSTPLVWCDDGQSEVARRAATVSEGLGWTDVSILDGGTAAWSEAGGELYSGVNVASKAFGELIERGYNTPRIDAPALRALLDSDQSVVVLDARPFNEYRRRSIPTAIDCPGAELVHRVRAVVDDPSTTVVVNCAGRTRSIIGAQSLINAGLENRVVALENGTMGWHLAGYEVSTGATEELSPPSPEARVWAAAAAARVGAAHGVADVEGGRVAQWLADETRTTYLLDVRTSEEFEACHLAGSRHAPGGQLVQATDAYLGTRNARLVLIDDDGVRATMTASWLQQMGWSEATVLAGGLEASAGAGALAIVTGKSPRPALARLSVPMIRPPDLAERLAAERGAVTVIDIGSSAKYRDKGHIPGAWWGVRHRLDQARSAIGDTAVVVLTSTDGTLAKLAVAEARGHWPRAEVLALAAGNKGWRHAGYEMEPGFTRSTTEADDVWSSPYDGRGDLSEQAMAYLAWEVGLVEQVQRDPLVQFPPITPLH